MVVDFHFFFSLWRHNKKYGGPKFEFTTSVWRRDARWHFLGKRNGKLLERIDLRFPALHCPQCYFQLHRFLWLLTADIRIGSKFFFCFWLKGSLFFWKFSHLVMPDKLPMTSGQQHDIRFLGHCHRSFRSFSPPFLPSISCLALGTVRTPRTGQDELDKGQRGKIDVSVHGRQTQTTFSTVSTFPDSWKRPLPLHFAFNYNDQTG